MSTAARYPRLLLLDSTPVGGGSATGQIKQMFLEHWPGDHLLQVHEAGGQLRLKPWTGTAAADDGLLVACREFRPDVVYFRPVDSQALFDFAELIVKELGRPLIVHVMDDWPERLSHTDAEKFTRLDAALRRVLAVASKRLSICDAMSREYKQRYGHDFTVVANGVALEEFPAKDWLSRPAVSRAVPFVVRYMGGLAEDMSDSSVVDVAKGVAELSSRLPIRFEVHTMPWYRKKADASMGHLSNVFIRELIADANQYRHSLQSADLLLIAYNFDSASIRYVRLSMANKLPECLASGVPLLAYGPRSVATIEYLKQLDCALVVDSRYKAQLATTIEGLVTDLNRCRALGTKGRALAGSKFRKADVQELFRTLVVQAAATALPDRPSVSTSQPLPPVFQSARLSIRMDQAPNGGNWYGAEAGPGGTFRWTGPGTRATLNVRVNRDREMLAVVAYHMPLIKSQLRKLRIEVDGRRVPHAVCTDVNPRCILARLPARGSTGTHETELALVLPQTLSPAGAGGPDKRQLGLAVYSVSIVPVESSPMEDLLDAGPGSLPNLFGLPRPERIVRDFPFSYFDGLAYLEANPDAAAALVAGGLSALEHYRAYGRAENRVLTLAVARPPNAGRFADVFDGTAYLSAYPDAAAAVQSGAVGSALDHYLRFGRERRIQTRFDGLCSRGTAIDAMRLEFRGGLARVEAQLKALLPQVNAMRYELSTGARVWELDQLRREALRNFDYAHEQITTEAAARYALERRLAVRLELLRSNMVKAQQVLAATARKDDLEQLQRDAAAVRDDLAAMASATESRSQTLLAQLAALRADAMESDKQLAAGRDELTRLRDETAQQLGTLGGGLDQISANVAAVLAGHEAFERETVEQLGEVRSSITEKAKHLESLKQDALRDLERVKGEFSTALAQREAREQAMLQQIDLLRTSVQDAQGRLAVAARAEDVDRMRRETTVDLDRLRRDATGDIDRVRRELISNAGIWRAREAAVLSQIDALKAEVAAAKTRAELAEVKVAAAQRELGAETWQIASSLQGLANRLDSAGSEVTKLQQEVGAVKGQTARMTHPSLSALNVLGYQAHPRMLQKADAERLAKHWAPLLGLKVEEKELYYLAHRVCSIENACTGRLAASVNDMLLRILVARAVKADKLKILEIGTLFGLGVGAMHEALAPLFERVQFTVIDPLEGFYGEGNKDVLTGVPVNRSVFEENLRRSGVGASDVKLIQRLSTDPQALKQASRKQYDLLIIDADHSYAGVKSDTEKFVATARPGGYVIFDDYGNQYWPDVKKYVDAEVLPRKDLRFVGAEWHTAVCQVTGAST